MKQNNEIRFTLTRTQHDNIQGKAESLGLTIKELILYSTLYAEVEIKIKGKDAKNPEEIKRNLFREHL
jgi:hypothetical protein